MRRLATLGRALESHAANCKEPDAYFIHRIMATPERSALPSRSHPASFSICPVYDRFDKSTEHVVRHPPVAVPGPRSRVQCLDAVVAPMPVSDLTCWARKPPRSFAAWLLRSRIENSQIPTTPIVIENSAGEVYGNNALPFG